MRLKNIKVFLITFVFVFIFGVLSDDCWALLCAAACCSRAKRGV